MSDRDEIHAAGGVIVWEQTDRARRFAVVHRPRYDDWSLPKGKLEPGEGFAEAALREIEEETGMRCELIGELPEVRYRVGERSKLVRYWLMRPLAGKFAVNEEVDELRRLPAAAARELLDYEQDARLIDDAEARLGD